MAIPGVAGVFMAAIYSASLRLIIVYFLNKLLKLLYTSILVYMYHIIVFDEVLQCYFYLFNNFVKNQQMINNTVLIQQFYIISVEHSSNDHLDRSLSS